MTFIFAHSNGERRKRVRLVHAATGLPGGAGTERERERDRQTEKELKGPAVVVLLEMRSIYTMN